MTNNYMSPEMIKLLKQDYNEELLNKLDLVKSNIFSLGIIIL